MEEELWLTCQPVGQIGHFVGEVVGHSTAPHRTLSNVDHFLFSNDFLDQVIKSQPVPERLEAGLETVDKTASFENTLADIRRQREHLLVAFPLERQIEDVGRSEDRDDLCHENRTRVVGRTSSKRWSRTMKPRVSVADEHIKATGDGLCRVWPAAVDLIRGMNSHHLRCQ